MSNTVITNYTREAILTRLNDLCIPINDAMKRHYATNLPNLTAPHVASDGVGKRYTRVSFHKFSEDRGKYYAAGVFFFVDLTNGNLLKAATYKAPEKKNPRGNIFDKDILTKLTPYGVVYLGKAYSNPDTLQGILGVSEV